MNLTIRTVACLSVVLGISIHAYAQADLTLRSVAPLGGEGNVAFPITGLSGITYTDESSPDVHRFAAIMDNSDKLIHIDVEFGADGSIVSNNVVSGLTLSASRDHEAIAFTNTTRNSVYVAAEGASQGVYEHSLVDGSLLSTVALPAEFAGAVGNLGLESLTRVKGNGFELMWTAAEEALPADGPLSTTSAGTTVRIQRFRDDGPGFAAEGSPLLYTTDPIHTSTLDAPRDAGDLSRSGLVELTSLGGLAIAVERSFAFNLFTSSYQSRLYAVDLLTESPKQHLLTLDTPGSGIGNLEGLTLGPQLDNGNFTLLGVVDDGGTTDFLSANRLVSFEITLPPPTVPGDNDGDGDVDLDDFNILAANFGQTSNYGPSFGDRDFDGDTDLDDFNILAANFGFGTESIDALPEPGASIWIAIACCAACTRLRIDH